LALRRASKPPRSPAASAGFAPKRALPSPEATLLELLAEGATVKEAATLLGISRRTATRRLERARGELAVETNAQATMLVSRPGR
jgi:DNA-binding NarL/FixJ family response regulator